MTAPSSAEVTRARLAGRAVAVLLVVAGLTACALSVLQVTGGPLAQMRLPLTLAFLLLGPGWAAAGFLRRAPAAHVWLLAGGGGGAPTLVVRQSKGITGGGGPGG